MHRSKASSTARVTRRVRLDAELVRRGLADSRTEAKRSIEQNAVIVEGIPTPRPSTLVDRTSAITITSQRRFVSRGGEKLDGALAELEVEVEGRRWLDAGASTGGFTDRLLQGGAAAVAAVDVGYGQLDWGLRNHERVVVLERTNVRALRRDDLPWTPEAVVADLSFISLTLVLPALVSVASEDADFILMVKPQFEVGRDSVGRGGVVRDPALWREAVEKVATAARGQGLSVAGAAPSRLPGPSGNREFFLHLRRGSDDSDAIALAVAEVTE